MIFFLSQTFPSFHWTCGSNLMEDTGKQHNSKSQRLSNFLTSEFSSLLHSTPFTSHPQLSNQPSPRGIKNIQNWMRSTTKFLSSLFVINSSRTSSSIRNPTFQLLLGNDIFTSLQCQKLTQNPSFQSKFYKDNRGNWRNLAVS